MALETNTLVNGTWTTQTLDVNAVLRHYDQQDREANVNAVEVEKKPLLGLLSQTVIRSPLAHWILPVRLRNSLSNDVAFIGIKELRTDGHLWDVVQKEDFGARIRNAKIVGSLKAYEKERNEYNRNVFGTQIKNEEDVDMDFEEELNETHAKRKRLLPPQALLLQLDTGDSVFLLLQQSENGTWEFSSSRRRVSKSMIKLEAGTHLAVDPSSRYLAIACSEGLFAIYALYPRDHLQRQYSADSGLHYVQSERHISLQGIIHKMEFLYPSADDDEHIILLVLVIWRGKTRMLLYEWQTGQNLQNIRAHSRKGHALEERHQMPLLVIPLTIKSSFILVSETTLAICNDILLNSPKILDFNTIIDKPTRYHHGSGDPLWTAWTRPPRNGYHAEEHDDIYIVREDGLVKNLEIQSEDDLIGADNNIGEFQSNCGTALASLDYNGYDATVGDLLITGGDSCMGGAYLIKARREPEFQQIIQNWSPAQDFVTTSPSQDHDYDDHRAHHHGNAPFPKPDKLYSCVGKGLKGEIVEFRNGFEGHIGLEMEFHTPIMDVWALPSQFPPFETEGGTDFLLSLGDCSALLRLSGDAGSIHEIDQASTAFDLRYRTITASTYSIYRLQVTEKSIVFIDGSEAHVHEGEQLFRIFYQESIYDEEKFLGCGKEISTAVTHEGLILFTVVLGSETFLRLQSLIMSSTISDERNPKPRLDAHARTVAKFPFRVTSLAICSVEQVLFGVVAQWNGQFSTITIQPIDGSPPRSIEISPTPRNETLDLEEIISIAASSSSIRGLVLLCGTRNGIVVMLQFDGNLDLTDCTFDRLGATPAIVRRDDYIGPKELFFVNSDSNLYAFTTVESSKSSSDHGNEGARGRKTINQIWLTDVTNTRRPQPKISSVTRLPIGTSAGINNGILLVDGSQLLVAGLSTQRKAVPRHIPIGGTPSRLMYSKTLEVIVVGATVNGRSTILFIDPESGTDVSRPFDNNKGIDLEFVAGLGNTNERIFRLLEWSYLKDGKTWYFIIVCTSTGRLVMISTEKEDPIQSSHIGEQASNIKKGNSYSAERPRIRYWTRYKWKCNSPIYSAIGFADGIFYCSGKTLHCETLDLSEKKFKPIAQYELPSAALNLIYEDGIVYALTSIHSLEILQLVNQGPRGARLSKFVRTHGDQVTRSSLHNRLIGQYSEHPLHLISDRECSVVGLWATHNTRADTLEEIFEAELPSSILRFRYGNCRPIWDPTWSSSGLGRVPNAKPASSSIGYPEILGLSIDGSVYHFTVLEFPIWKFFRFLANLAAQSPKVYELTNGERDISNLQPLTEPKIMMHVDGDILRRCLEDRSLEELLSSQNTEEESRLHAKFREFFEPLHVGDLGRNSPISTLINRAYEDLEFFLRPVL